MAKATAIKVKMESTAGTGYFKTTTKTRNCANKFEMMKYDPVVRRRVKFVEKKVK